MYANILSEMQISKILVYTVLVFICGFVIFFYFPLRMCVYRLFKLQYKKDQTMVL